MKRIFVITLAAACVAALAQGPGAGAGGGQGGPRGDRMGMMGMQGRGMGGGLQIITRPDVQKELALTEAQKTQVAELFPARGGRGAGGPGGGGAAGGPAAGPRGGAGGGEQAGGRGQGGPGGFGGDPSQMQAQQAEREAKLKTILNETQWKRFNELRLQMEGVNALMRPDVAKEVGLTEEQQQRMRDIQRASMEAMRESFQGGGGGFNREEMMAAMEKSRKETETKMLAVLTTDQKAKWEAMKGKPFTFEGQIR